MNSNKISEPDPSRASDFLDGIEENEFIIRDLGDFTQLSEDVILQIKQRIFERLQPAWIQ